MFRSEVNMPRRLVTPLIASRVWEIFLKNQICAKNVRVVAIITFNDDRRFMAFLLAVRFPWCVRLDQRVRENFLFRCSCFFKIIQPIRWCCRRWRWQRACSARSRAPEDHSNRFVSYARLRNAGLEWARAW